MTALRHRLPLALIASLTALSACGGAPSAPRSRADVAARQACRDEVDRVYRAQNRAELSQRDERDYAFAGSYNSGIVTRGISSRYGRDQAVSSCVDQAGGPGGQALDTTPSQTFSPTPR